jgi:transcription elongation factor Elf1
MKEHFDCPGCSNQHKICSSTFSQLSALEIKMFNEMLIRCGKCDRVVRLEMSDSVCDYHGNREDQNLTSRVVVNQPLETEPSKLESRAASKVLSRLLYQNKGTTCSLSTGGRVCQYEL